MENLVKIDTQKMCYAYSVLCVLILIIITSLSNKFFSIKHTQFQDCYLLCRLFTYLFKYIYRAIYRTQNVHILIQYQFAFMIIKKLLEISL